MRGDSDHGRKAFNTPKEGIAIDRFTAAPKLEGLCETCFLDNPKSLEPDQLCELRKSSPDSAPWAGKICRTREVTCVVQVSQSQLALSAER